MGKKKLRTVHIDGKEWKYVVDRLEVRIYHPDTGKPGYLDRVHQFVLHDGMSFTKWSELLYQRVWEQPPLPEVTPAMVKAYIQRQLLPRPQKTRRS